MSCRTAFADTSSEMLLQKHRNGVKLIRPFANQTEKCTSVSDVLQLPFNVYFLDLQHQLKNANDIYADSFGCYSVKRALNKTAWDIATRASAEAIIASNVEVTDLHRSKMFEVSIELKNKINFSAFAMKFPLYDTLNQLIGVFGFSTIVGKYSLSDFITRIARLGLLENLSDSSPASTQNIVAGVQLTDRQMQVVRGVVRGKTSKDIAKQCGLSYRTIQHYLDHIKMKLNVDTRAELIDAVIDFL